MSLYERGKATGRLPSWRSHEAEPARAEGLRLRGPFINPADFVPPAPTPPKAEPIGPASSPEPANIQTESPAARVKPAPKPAVSSPAPHAPSAETSPRKTEQPKPAPAPAVAAPSVAPLPAAIPSSPGGPLLDLRMAIRFIWAKRLLVLALAVIGAVLGAVAIPMLPQKYTAVSSLYFDPRQATGTDPGQAAPVPELITSLIDSQTQILGSGRVLGRVVDDLKLDQNPKFSGNTTGETARSTAIAVLSKAVSIMREASTYIVTLKVTTYDPEKSAEIANDLIKAFMSEERSAASTLYKSTNSLFDDRLADLRRQLEEAEKAVEVYRASNDMITVEGGLISDKRLTALNTALVTAQQKTIEAAARADAAKKLSFETVVAGNGDANNATASTALANLRQQYAVQAAAVSSLQSQLGARHPRLAAARSSLDSISAEIRSELQRLVSSAQTQYQQAQQAEQDIARELDIQKARQVNTSDKMVGLNELQRKADAARDAYQALVKRSGQANEDQTLAQSNIRIISEADVPLKADGPGKKILMIAGMFAGCVLGLSLGILIAIGFGLVRNPAIRTYFVRAVD